MEAGARYAFGDHRRRALAISALRLPYRILIALTGSALIGYAIYASGTRGLADWSTMRWRHEVTGWADRRATPPPPERLQEAIGSLTATLARTPDDPTLNEHLGVALELRAAGFPPGSDRRRYLAEALVYFRKAAVLRPTSPYTWGNILVAKYRLGQIDAEFFGAMHHALDFGPGEPAVQLIVADTGLGAWDGLDSGLRARVTENLQRTAVRQTDALARIATKQRRIELVCAMSIEKMKTKLKCVK